MYGTRSKCSQNLARYFNATPSVRVGILTNGVRVKVFTDLQQPNVMDDKPWMDFDLRTAKQAEIDAPILRKAIQAAILDHVARSFNTSNTPEDKPDKLEENINKETDSSLKEFNPSDPPDLQHTRCEGTFGSLSFKKWNDLVRIAYIQSFAKAQSFEVLQTLTKVSIRKGDHTGIGGYHFLPEIGISIQGTDSNSAWQYAFQLAQYLNVSLKVTVEWRNNEKAAFPGKKGLMEWIASKSV